MGPVEPNIEKIFTDMIEYAIAEKQIPEGTQNIPVILFNDIINIQSKRIHESLQKLIE